MNPLLRALIDFGHLGGVALAAASIAVCLATGREGSIDTTASETASKAPKGPPLALSLSAVILLLGTGLLKWAPSTGGVGWLGGKGLNTALLHAKLVLGLILLHLLLSLVRRPSRTRALVACILGATIVLLAVLHRSHPF